MATDGRTSFAIFLYGNVSILNAINSQTGFNSGDGVEFSNIQVSSISRVNVYRIDGKWTGRSGVKALHLCTIFYVGICIEKITASAPNCLLLANSISFAFSCDLQQLTPDSCLCDSTASMSSDLCVPIGNHTKGVKLLFLFCFRSTKSKQYTVLTKKQLNDKHQSVNTKGVKYAV